MKAGKDSRILWAGALVVVVCATAAASPLKSRYVFIADESTVTLSGGFAGVHEEFAVEGQFVLLFDPTGGKAAFRSVDATLVGDSPFLSLARDLNELFNMTSLSGEAIDDRAIAFEGQTADGLESTVLLRLELVDGASRLTGRTIPPPDSADFFVLEIEANAIHVPRYAGGTGEPNTPYLIETAEHLNTLGADPDDYDKHFRLTADIDLSEYLFDRAVIAPHTDIATERFDGTPFSGVLDGNGHAISNLTIKGGSHLGLIGRLDSDAEIRDLGVVDVNIVGRDNYVGGLAGDVFEGAVNRCYVTGSVSGERSVGGLVGYSLLANVTDCYTRGSVSGHYDVGGLVGHVFGGAVSRCHVAGTISGYWNVGGLAGSNVSNLTDSYARGTVSGISGSRGIGGLVGCNGWRDRGGEAPGTIANCYSSARVPVLGDPKSTGGLVGWQPYGDVIASFWDVEASGQAVSDGGTGLTTAEMQTAATFLAAGWDFVGESDNGTDDVWFIDEGRDYPRLAWEHEADDEFLDRGPVEGSNPF